MMNGSASATTSSLTSMSPELAGLAEIAELLAVTKRSAWNYTRREDFPEPIDRLASGPIWRRVDVEKWGKAHLPLPPGRRPQS
jgi:predicted DNA-binding transcriptional regulator AlpA